MKELKKNLIFSLSGFLFTHLLECYAKYKFLSLNIQAGSILITVSWYSF